MKRRSSKKNTKYPKKQLMSIAAIIEVPLPLLQGDVLDAIFSNLDVSSLLQLQLVCKNWRDQIRNAFFWKVKIYRSKMELTNGGRAEHKRNGEIKPLFRYKSEYF
jgi:hypothetical protein